MIEKVVTVLGNSRPSAVNNHRQLLLTQSVEALLDGCLVITGDRLPVRCLVTGCNQAVQSQRVVLRCCSLLFEQRTEDSRLNGGKLKCHGSGSVEPIPEISEPGQDIFSLVQLAIQGGGKHRQRGINPFDRADAFRRTYNTNKPDVTRAVLAQDCDRLYSGTAGRQHRIHDNHRLRAQRREFAIVTMGDGSLVIALQAYVADADAREKV